jgi:hypothetical protein
VKGMRDVVEVFEAFPNDWFGLATIAKYARVSKKQAETALKYLIEYDFVCCEKRPEIHAQAFFYKASEKTRKNLLQNRAENRNISGGKARPVEMQGAQSEPYVLRRENCGSANAY